MSDASASAPPPQQPAPIDPNFEIPPNVYAVIGTTEEAKRSIGHVRSRLASAIKARNEVGVLEDGYIDTSLVESLVITEINGDEGIPEQTVQVEYLKSSQRMALPGILGMNVDGSESAYCQAHPTLCARYHKLAVLSYATLKQMVTSSERMLDLRAIIDALPVPTVVTRKDDWLTKEYYRAEDGTEVPRNDIQTTFAYISAAAQMNADVRDFGFLTLDGNTKTDSAWKTVSATTITENDLRLKMHAYTLQNIAAMNYEKVNGSTIAAWTRAYGVGLGIMPHHSSATVIEYYFTNMMPKREHRATVSKWAMDYERNPLELCSNLLAMFGLFHLNKDHTHRTGDGNMARVQKSYVGTVRTATTEATNEYLMAHLEEVTRTAQHPFGLAQTYWLAKAMGALGKLAAPLALRVDTCPPPVQRLMMVCAMLKEWASVPAGQILNGAFRTEFRVVMQAVATVKENPPAYSGLHRLYGIDTMLTISDAIASAVATLLPPIFGYVECTHVTTSDERSGPALALSWKNISREHNAVLMGWRSMWDRYFDSMDTHDMVDFAMKTRVAMREYRASMDDAGRAREGE